MSCDPKNFAKSAKAYTKACRYLTGGVNSPVRAYRGVDTKPLFIASAKGSKIYDIDGNEFIDYVGSWGTAILGHAHPKVIQAINDAAKKGTSFGAPTIAETKLAKKITAAFKSIEKLRLVNSGTEAVMTAIRLARGYTGKDLIIKMAGCYHGHSDSLLSAAGSGLAEQAIPSSAGVPEPIAKLTIVTPYNDTEAVKTALKKFNRQVAAVLVEPVAANMGVIPPVDGYLQALRNLCDENKALLIFDEVITGFRLAAGGAQQLFNIKADITCLGKVIGAGLPLAAFGARADIMDILAPAGKVYQAGTLSGNPIATAAANVTLDLLIQNDCFKKLEATSALLESSLTQAAKQANIPIRINRVGSIMSCFFTDKTVRNLEDVQSTNIEQFKKFFSKMLQQGIYLAPSAYEAMFVSLAHTTKDIEKTTKAARKAFLSVKNEQ